jgi:nitrite reductase/ring-hydroxylating ferredoxin subunit
MALCDLPDPGAKVLDFQGGPTGQARFSILVARSGALVRAYLNSCPHARFPLERFDGVALMDGAQFLICAAHGASFRVADGACVGGPAKAGLTPFPILVRDGAIWAG